MSEASKPHVSVAAILSRLGALERENETLRRRIGQLEAGARNLKWATGSSLIALLIGLVAASAILMKTTPGTPAVAAPTSDPASSSRTAVAGRVIEAEGFIVRDRAGRARAILGRFGDPQDDRHAETGLRLFTPSGDVRGSFELDAHQWGQMTIGDDHNRARVCLFGGGDEVGLAITDPEGKPRAELSHEDGFGPSLSLHAKGMQLRQRLAVDPRGVPVLDVFDGHDRVSHVLNVDGYPNFKSLEVAGHR